MGTGAPATIDVAFGGHATVRLDIDGIGILTDPLLRPSLGPLRRHGALPHPALVDGISLVLVSHGHPDHLDAASLAAIPGSPTVVVPRGLGPTVRRWVTGPVVELAAGEAARVGPLLVEATHARHWIAPGAPRARPVGYLVAGRATAWFAGDTGRYPAMAALAGRVDLALLPVWTWGPHLGPGHLGPRAAADVLALIGARAAVPIHWGTLYPRGLERVHPRPLRGPGPAFAAHAARLAPDADVRVLAPGEATSYAFQAAGSDS